MILSDNFGWAGFLPQSDSWKRFIVCGLLQLPRRQSQGGWPCCKRGNYCRPDCGREKGFTNRLVSSPTWLSDKVRAVCCTPLHSSLFPHNAHGATLRPYVPCMHSYSASFAVDALKRGRRKRECGEATVSIVTITRPRVGTRYGPENGLRARTPAFYIKASSSG